MPNVLALNDPFEGIFKLVLEDINNPLTQYANQIYYRNINNLSSVFSLSEVDYNILMWAHYADNHKGICIEFSTNNPNSIFHTIKQVQYSENIPIVHRNNRSDKELVDEIFLNKTRDWDYEKEWRIISSKSFYYEPISEFDITGVILGERISAVDEEWVLDWLSDYSHIKLYKCRMSKDSYKMNIDKVK